MYFLLFLRLLPYFKDGNTLLLIAIEKGYVAVVTTLLDKGVDVHPTDNVSI